MVLEIVLHTFSPIIIVIKTVKMQTIILRSIYVWREFSVVFATSTTWKNPVSAKHSVTSSCCAVLIASSIEVSSFSSHSKKDIGTIKTALSWTNCDWILALLPLTISWTMTVLFVSLPYSSSISYPFSSTNGEPTTTRLGDVP